MRWSNAVHLVALAAIPFFVVAGGCTGEEPPATGRAHQPIIGGSPAGAWEYPATGGLVQGDHIYCTGTLVAPSAVLTAAHCLDPEELDGEVPGFTLARDEAEITMFNVYDGLNVRLHPGYIRDSQDTSPGLVNDLGVLMLRQIVEEVTPEELIPEGVANATLVVGTPLTIVGYGYTDLALTRSGIKFKATAPLVYIGNWELQLSEPGDPQPCYGDSGGPVFITLPDGRRYIAGVVSRGPGEEGGCDQGAIATRGDPYQSWLDSATATGSCSTAGGGVPPWTAVLLGVLTLAFFRRRRRG